MKRICIILAGILVIGAFSFAKKDKSEGQPEITFKETVWDFGTVKKDRPATHVFEFTNTGTGNLRIKDASAACGCTHPEYSTQPVAPGKTGKIKVSYNAAQPGAFNKTVRVRTNGKTKYVTLRLMGVVAPK